jgi:eukaryotic-like serine/threonine-protein kinase
VPDIRQLVGAQVQGWTLTRVIGSGADGIVYAGTKDGVERAIKLFLPESLDQHGRAEARNRLDLQLSLVSGPTHPNLVQVYGGGEVQELGTFFLIMDLVPGTSLDKLIDKVPYDAVPGLLAQLAAAAKFLEDQDLYHRDIKPANIVISDDFQTLTLLDLGIVYHLPGDDDNGRLSGMEFVATLRYSPPEFVWRTEQGSADGAWKAVSFYQIGATLHDMIMRKPLFSGMDQPRARLYDCVKDETPHVQADGVPRWLVQLAQACLLKDWRQRLYLVNWASFNGPAPGADASVREMGIRLRQMRKEEMRQSAAKRAAPAHGPTREQELWQLNGALFSELRNYLINTAIFPRFRSTEDALSDRHYVSHFAFDSDEGLAFVGALVVRIEVKVAPEVELATTLSFEATLDGKSVTAASWTEMFTVDAAFANCQQALLDTVESVVPKD